MVQTLADCFGVDVKVFDRWSLEEASGCLGQELKIVLERTCPVNLILPVIYNPPLSGIYF